MAEIAVDRRMRGLPRSSILTRGLEILKILA